MAEQIQPDYNLLTQLAYLKGGGTLPGKSGPELLAKAGQGITQSVNDYDKIINDSLANKKAALEQQRIGNVFNIPTPGQVQGQQSTYVANNIYPQPNAQLESGTSLPSGVQGPSQMQAQSGPAPIAPMVQQYAQGQQKLAGMSPETSVFQAKELWPDAMKMALQTGQIPMFINKTTNQISFDPQSVLQGYEPFTKLAPQKAAEIASKQAEATRPQTYISGEQALAQGKGTKDTKIISPTQQGASPYADVRATQNIMNDLPSRSGPSTQAGAASTVQFSARQGKQLVANPGSPQKLALSAVDLARTVQRNAPTVDTLTNAGFADNLATKLSLLSQKITADPNSKDVPKLRKEIFDIFTDLENSSKPIIQRQLDTTESLWKTRLPPDWGTIKKSELGDNLPPIQFNETSPIPGVLGTMNKDGKQYQKKSDGLWYPVQ